ncbi:MAG: hypothetical protein Q8909_14170 [Bacteroidota bacterium]|nr:hypothetical protein [Bacteroidota bacterium]
MKTILLFLIATFGLIVICFGQNNQLVLKSKTHDKIVIVPEGKKVKVIDNGGKTHAGKISVYTDSIDGISLLVVGKDTLGINEISAIKVRPLLTKMSGGVLTAGGGSLTIFGLYVVIAGLGLTGDWADMEGFIKALAVILGGGLAFAGVLVTTAGIVLWKTFFKKYPSSKWEYQFRHVVGRGMVQSPVSGSSQ